jgi:uncharacterized membrane protein
MNSLLDFFRRFFVDPIWERSGYNWVNTLAYGLLLGVAAVITYRAIKKTGYRFNIDLFIMFMPFLILATTVRALVDAGRYPYTYLLISPGIYITTMAIFALSILVALVARRLSGIEVKKSVIFIGTVLAASQLALLIEMVKRPAAGALIILVCLGVCSSIYLMSRKWGDRLTFFRGRENLMVVWFHLIDATVTFIGVDFYGYAEQHVLPRSLIEIFGTAAVMYLLKLAVLPVVLYLLDKYVEENEMNVFMKMIIMVLGLAPATRNFLRIIIGA